VKKNDSAQPLSAMAYAIIALAGLIFAIGFTFFYVYQVPKLVESGTQGQVFYLLLIPWALSCAAFLFGTMRSYARFTYKHLGNFLELGGPVVLFCLVLIGGFKLVPPAPQTFDLTVRAHSADGRDPLITSGKITIELDTALNTQSIGPNGEADFKGIPPKFESATLRILPLVEGYEEKWQRHKLQGHVLDLPLERAAQPVTVLTGSIVPAPAKGKNIKILVDGQKGETSPDEFGRFWLNVNGKAGDRVRLKVFADGNQVYDAYQVLPGPVMLKLNVKEKAAAVTGKWTTQILTNPFDKTDRFRFFFKLEVRGAILLGSVRQSSTEDRYSFERRILDGTIKGNVISFYIQQSFSLEGKTFPYKDLFYGTVSKDEIAFTVESDRPRGFPPQKFMAQPEPLAKLGK
jgi:hypothetical protein